MLFAYCEVPQASTGFSPFELLYGRAVCGPLDILRETWEVSEKSSESVISHVLNMREKLEKMSQVKQKTGQLEFVSFSQETKCQFYCLRNYMPSGRGHTRL